MKTINLGSGVTLSVPDKPAASTSDFVDVALCRDTGARAWKALVLEHPNSWYGDCKLRIPVAVLEGRVVPEPAKAEPDWRGFVWMPAHGPNFCVRVRWEGVDLDLHPDGRWVVTSHYFPTRAEAEAALAKAKHPGESA